MSEGPRLKTENQENPLTPRSEWERLLWEQIDRADPAIRTILKRINRVAQQKFPDLKVYTSDSCSGHINADGSLFTWVIRTPGYDNIVEKKEPSIHFLVDPVERKGVVIPYFRDIFMRAVSRTNELLHREAIEYFKPSDRAAKNAFTPEGEWIRGPFIGYSISILDKHRSYEALKTFWSEVGKLLQEIDGLSTHSELEPSIFYDQG